MAVAVFKNKNISLATREVAKKLGGIKLPKDKATVLIKPNCNTGAPPPASTNPLVIKELIRLALEAGAGKVIVGDRSWVQFFIPRQKNTVKNMKENGIYKVAKDLGAEVIGFEEGKWQRFRSERAKHWRGSFRITQTLNEADYIITVPVLKTHWITDFTLSLKNSVGLIHTWDRLRLHSSDIQFKTAEINLAYPVDLVVIDGSYAFISGGPSEGETVSPNLVIASDNRIEADITGYNTLQELGAKLPLNPKEHPMIARAMKLKLDGFGN